MALKNMGTAQYCALVLRSRTKTHYGSYKFESLTAGPRVIGIQPRGYDFHASNAKVEENLDFTLQNNYRLKKSIIICR